MYMASTLRSVITISATPSRMSAVELPWVSMRWLTYQ